MESFVDLIVAAVAALIAGLILSFIAERYRRRSALLKLVNDYNLFRLTLRAFFVQISDIPSSRKAVPHSGDLLLSASSQLISLQSSIRVLPVVYRYPREVRRQSCNVVDAGDCLSDCFDQILIMRHVYGDFTELLEDLKSGSREYEAQSKGLFEMILLQDHSLLNTRKVSDLLMGLQ